VLRRRAAVLGSPIAHSQSPALHRAAYAALGLPWQYDAVEVRPEGLPAFLDGLDDSWVGLSLTMPLKETVLPLLDDVSTLATRTRSVNTVLLGARRHGENTDVHGIAKALQEVGFRSAERGLVLGAGATARSAAAALALLGVARVDVAARRAQAAAAVLEVAAGAAGAAVPWDAAALDADVVVSTVPGDAAAVLAQRVPARPGLLLDVTYHPWPTRLAGAWQRAGGVVAPGALMLLWQAARQVELMTGRPAPVPVMRAALDQR
jgi:shikimate dehydrogenase